MLRQPSEVEAISAQESLIRPSERVALKRVLACPAHERGQQELLPVHRLLQKVEFVAKLELKVQEDLANIVFYEHFEPFTTIFQEGDVGKSFYIIVSGSLAVQKKAEDGSLTTLVTLTAGQSFGELALVEENGRRAATIVTTSEVECLTIEGSVYRSQLARIHQEELHLKVDVLRHQPTFAGWSPKDLEHLASIMLVKKVPHNTVVIEQGHETDALYFIKSGEVRIVRRMRPTQRFLRELEKDPLLSSRISPTSTWCDKYRCLPKSFSQSPRSVPLTARSSSPRALSSRESHVEEPDDIFVELMTLGPYSTFGEVAALKGSRRAASVISNAFTELLILTRSSLIPQIPHERNQSRHDLLNKVDSRTRRKLEEHCESYRDDRELLEDLIEGLRWEKYKADLIQSILAESHKEHYLVAHTNAHNCKSVRSWKP